jgi:predicted ATPase
MGEPGIGKSRLTRALVERVAAADGPATVVRYFCSPYHASTALFPVAEQLQRAAAFESGDAPAVKLAKLAALLARAVADPAPAVPLLATLLGLPATGCYRPPDLTPAALKARTLAALLDQLKGLARAGPVLVLFEDLHWADPTTTELLVAVAAAAPHLAVLLLATARPEFRPPWPEGGTATTLALGRLDRRQSAAVLQRLTGAKDLPEALETDILAKTDGVPLFLEELTKAVLETGWLTDAGDRYELNRPLPTLDVPDTLQGSLMARLDRLAGPKLVAQVGAVIGRDFDRALLGAVAEVPEAELDAALAALEESGLVQRRGEPRAATYSFKHALVRDAAYESLLRSRRQALHGRIVRAIERDFPQLATGQPELLAHHCAGAGLVEQAVRYGRQAGEQAVRRAANLEAIAHFRRALACNETLPESEERARATLGILAQLGPALMSVQGWPAPEVGAVFERAGEVARGLERSAALTPPLVGLWLFHVARGQFERAEAISGELFEIARDLDDPDVLLQAHHAAWPTHWLRGTCRAAADHIDAGLALYDERRHERHRYLYLGHDPAVCALAIGAPVAWMMGQPERADRLEREALDLARRLRHAPSLAHALWFVGEAQVARGDAEAAKATTDELLALCDEHKLPQPRATGLMFQGWALARAGETALGTARVQEGLGVWHRLGARSYLPRAHYLLAECHLLAGRRADGLGEVARALAVAAETGERWCVARVHALRADLLLQGGDAAGAEASLRTALGIAREQGALGWELSAATALARLLAERGERGQAHDLLAPVRAAFPPGGFGGPDLRAAEAVLASLR